MSRLPLRDQAETGYALQQRRQPVRKRGIVDLDGDRNRLGLCAHASGLSPIVRSSSSGSPARLSESLTVAPTLSGPNRRMR